MQLRLRPTVENDVEPVVFLEALCRLVLVVAERDLADGRAAFHLDESDVGECLVVVRVWFSRDDVESAVVLFYALNHPTALGLMPDRFLDSNPLDLLIADHRRDTGGRALGV